MNKRNKRNIAPYGDEEFTPNELNQIAQLVYTRMETNRPIDARKFSRRVLQWARYDGIIKRGEELLGQRDWLDDDIRRWGENRWYFNPSYYIDPRSLPPAALWIIISEKVFPYAPTWGANKRNIGYTVTKSSGWGYLDLWYNGSSHWKNDDEISRWQREIINVLGWLDRWGYISFQHAGLVWQINNYDRWEKRYNHE